MHSSTQSPLTFTLDKQAVFAESRRWLFRAFFLLLLAGLMFPELILAQNTQAVKMGAAFVPRTWRVSTETIPLQVEVDFGNDYINKLNINWQLDEGAIHTTDVQFDINTFDPDESKIYTLESPFSVTEAGKHQLRIWVELIEWDGQNNPPADDTLTINMTAIDTDVPRNILFEEFTGTWCGWCPDGYEAVEKAITRFPGKILPVMLHNNDNMATDDGDVITQRAGVEGFPSAQVDRYTFRVNGQPAVYRDQWEDYISIMLNAAPMATMELEVVYDAESDSITANLNSKFLADFKGMPRFNIYVVEDSVSGVGTGWDQANYTNNTPSSKWYKKGDPMRNFQHMHVLRTIEGGVNGVMGVLPTDIKANETFSYSTTFKRPAGTKADHVQIYAFVYNESGRTNEREIFNTTGRHLDNSPVEVVVVSRNKTIPNAIQAATLQPNPAADASTLSFTLDRSETLNLHVLDITGRSIREQSLGNLNAGAHAFSVETATLSPGIYFVALSAGSHTEIQKLIVQ